MHPGGSERKQNEGMRIVARFDPPEAQTRLAEWRLEHAEALTDLSDEALQIDIGRAIGGDFVQVIVDEGYAERF